MLTAQPWPCPLPGGGCGEEWAVTLVSGRSTRLLVAPALFDEANRMRRFTLEVMRRLDRAGIDCLLPDLPGQGESLASLARQTPGDWQLALRGAAVHFGATHVLAIRGGALVAPADLPGWRLAPVNGVVLLRQMLRAMVIAEREAGREVTAQALLDRGRAEGLVLSGWALGADFIDEFMRMEPPAALRATTVDQDMLGGGGLWLRAEPGEDAAQAEALAAVIMVGLRAGSAA